LRTIPQSYAPTALECNHQDSVVIKDCVPNLFQFLNSLGHTLPFLFFLPGWLNKPFLRPFFSGFSEFGPYSLFGKFPVLSSFQWISDSPFAFSDTFAVIVGISEMHV